MQINVIPNFIDEAISPAARAVGDTLSELWNLAIGSHVSLWSEKQLMKQQANLQDYKNKIEEKTQSIPEQHVTEPNLHIVGPALEASKYYIESEELRDMFANLIASSIDDRKITKTHPSFVEIIKQMSPLDAQNLTLYKNVSQFPICEYKYLTESGGNSTQYTNVFLENRETNNLSLIASSLENLSRLGLILISYDRYITEENVYDKFYNTNIYRDLQNKLRHSDYAKYNKVEAGWGLARTTPLGRDFVQICLL